MKKITKLLFVCILCLTSLLALISLTKANNKVNAAVPEGLTLDTNVDTVSLKDLTFADSSTGNGKLSDDVHATYNKTSTNGSLVFEFKYDVVDDTATDGISLCIYTGVHSGDIWDDATGNAFLFRGDGNFFLRWSTSQSKLAYRKTSALTKGLHDIEIGRIALFDGENPTGKYYVYYKVDGVEIDSDSNPYDVSGIDNRLFFHFSTDNKNNNILYDVDYSEETLAALRAKEPVCVKQSSTVIPSASLATSLRLYF